MNFNALMEIDLDKLNFNIKTLKETYKDYQYHLANLKNNAFGMGYKIINTLVDAGINYILVSTLNEALEIRKINTSIPILISFELDSDYIYDAITNNVSITISNLDNLTKISNKKLKDKLNVHLLIDNGSNKIGLKNKEEVENAINIINNTKNLVLEGIYTDLTTYGILDEDYYKQFNNFLNCLENLEKDKLIIHVNEPIMYHKKHDFINGIRYDLSLLGIEENIEDSVLANIKIKSIEKKYNDLSFPNIDLELIFRIKAPIVGFSKALKNTLVGSRYIAKEDLNLAIVNIGHKDGITKALKTVFINGKKCPIVADNVDNLFIAAPFDATLNEYVYIIGEETDIYEVIDILKTNRYYLMSFLNNNLERAYLNSNDNNSIL